MGEGMAKVRTEGTPQQIIQDLWAARGSQALVAGVELDVFSLIADGQRTANKIARAAGATERGTEHLLDTLVGLGYLKKKGREYRLRPVAERFLVRGKEAYIGGFVHETKLTWNGWSQLTEVIRTGKPVKAVDTDKGGREFFPQLVEAIFPLSFGAARAAVASLSEKNRKRIKSVLDVAAGSAAWSLAFAQSMPDVRVTVLDYPEVTPIARRFAEKFGVADRYEYSEGNLREIDFGRDRYDLVILGHVIHSEGEEWGKKLVGKSFEALKDGGLLLIAEIIPNDARTGPSIPLLFGLNMLVHTEQGDVFTLREYRKWLKDAGFKKMSTIEAPSPSPLILAKK